MKSLSAIAALTFLTIFCIPIVSAEESGESSTSAASQPWTFSRFGGATENALYRMCLYSEGIILKTDKLTDDFSGRRHCDAILVMELRPNVRNVGIGETVIFVDDVIPRAKQAGIEAIFTKKAAELEKIAAEKAVQAEREKAHAKYRGAFDAIMDRPLFGPRECTKSLEEIGVFETAYASNDPEGLIAKLQIRKKEAKDKLDAIHAKAETERHVDLTGMIIGFVVALLALKGSWSASAGFLSRRDRFRQSPIQLFFTRVNLAVVLSGFAGFIAYAAIGSLGRALFT